MSFHTAMYSYHSLHPLAPPAFRVQSYTSAPSLYSSHLAQSYSMPSESPEIQHRPISPVPAEPILAIDPKLLFYSPPAHPDTDEDAEEPNTSQVQSMRSGASSPRSPSYSGISNLENAPGRDAMSPSTSPQSTPSLTYAGSSSPSREPPGRSPPVSAMGTQVNVSPPKRRGRGAAAWSSRSRSSPQEATPEVPVAPLSSFSTGPERAPRSSRASRLKPYYELRPRRGPAAAPQPTTEGRVRKKAVRRVANAAADIPGTFANDAAVLSFGPCSCGNTVDGAAQHRVVDHIWAHLSQVERVHFTCPVRGCRSGMKWAHRERHITTIHLKLGPDRCPMGCGAVFTSGRKDSVSRHCDKKHPGWKKQLEAAGIQW
ncbi:hypothetical protein OBBRIDRAFT_875784 [Obba rivulosa]|uniref:Uncharacterized protein n=1 Tax=Obba rivulosa TaxID=1052685 RepID=A0A8E2DJU1_9APHY|nr:hypothetical protein OBBRIDRAFT_875784 [Obba rivulosa]